MQYLVRDEKYSRLWSSCECREIFLHANKGWFTVLNICKWGLDEYYNILWYFVYQDISTMYPPFD
jgi:hypothetical protein